MQSLRERANVSRATVQGAVAKDRDTQAKLRAHMRELMAPQSAERLAQQEQLGAPSLDRVSAQRTLPRNCRGCRQETT